jgi:tRNA threonylcarbamoyladenosine biosynthesis protein TsaB
MENGIQVIKKQCAMDAGELAAELNGMGLPVIFLGDGVPVYRELFEESLTVPFKFAPAQMNRQRGACVAALGMLVMTETAGGAYVVSSDEFTPDYLRKPQAEREREARISPQGAAARLAGDR